MKFTPRTKQQLEEDGLLPAGIYPFQVEKAAEKVSNKGNPMIELGIRLYGDNGREGYAFHYLMEKMPQYLAQFCRFTGMESLYDSGNVDADDCLNREGWAKVKIEKGTGSFPSKNVIDHFCPKPEKAGDVVKRTDAERGKNPGTGVDDSDPDSEVPF